MKCPKCQNEMQKSATLPDCWICYNCKVRFKPVNELEKNSTESSNVNHWADIKESTMETFQTVGDAIIEKYSKNKTLSKVGLVVIDKETKKFQIDGVPSKGVNKSSLLGKTAKGVLALSTLGMSIAVDKAMNSSWKKLWFNFNQLMRYELIQDDSIVTSGGVGMALVGGLVFGPAGAVAGGITGKRKTKRKIENLFINVTLND